MILNNTINLISKKQRRRTWQKYCNVLKSIAILRKLLYMKHLSFYSRLQQEDETFESFLTDIKKLSQMSEFGIMTNNDSRQNCVWNMRQSTTG